MIKLLQNDLIDIDYRFVQSKKYIYKNAKQWEKSKSSIRYQQAMTVSPSILFTNNSLENTSKKKDTSKKIMMKLYTNIVL